MDVFYLLKPIFLHGFSASTHLALLFVLSMAWAYHRLNMGGHEHAEPRLKNKARFLYYKLTLFSCLGLSLFNLFLSILNYFYWYRNDGSVDNLVSQWDFILRTLTWFVIYAYLRLQFSNSSQKKYPFLLRIWWGFFVLLSSSFLVLDIISHINHEFLPARFGVLDFMSLLVGSFLFYMGFFDLENGEVAILEEPLLNGRSSSNSSVDGSSKSRTRNAIPYSNAGLLSLLSFSWMSPLLSIGNKKALDLDDVPQLSDSDSVKGVFPIFIDKLEYDISNGGTGVGTLHLSKALFLSVRKDVLCSAFFALMYTSASYVGPYLMDTFVQCLHGRQDFSLQGYILILVFLSAKLVECLSQRQWFFRTQRFGMQGQAALVAMIYTKGLSLSSRSRQDYTSGEVFNLMSVDAERIGEFSWYLIDLWLVPFQIGLAMFILYKSLGPASLVALAAAVFIMVANIPLGKLEKKFQSGMMEVKDERMRSTTETLRNVRILKLQGWEMSFLSKITELRKGEESWLRKYLYTSAVATFLYWAAPTFVAVVSFVACIPLGVPLTSGRILSAIATFKVLQEPIYNLPDTIAMLAQTKISLDRIASFLCLEDLQPDTVEKLPRVSSEIAVEISNGNFSWDHTVANLTLKDLNFRVYHGMRVAICGTVGSGKSSLLSCILGEVPKISGTVKLGGTKAYVAQSPWIQGGTIEYNILFGKEMERERYEQVLEACSLKKDLEILSFGDQTIIGERGINLSGGQKQRIQIARALYQDADIYLFDDPFSAVDAHTGTHLFKECLLEMMSSKTVIYVTHQLEFLPSADHIMVMKDGRVTQAGKYEDILISGTDFMELVDAHKKAFSTIDSIETRDQTQVPNSESSSYQMEDCTKELEKNDENIGKMDEIFGHNRQLVQEEEREKGKVGLSVYWKYITTAHGGALVPFILLAQILFQIFQIGSNYWMAWASPISEDERTSARGSDILQLYIALALGSSICILVRAVLHATAGFRTATLLFNKMHMCVFRAPMSFFDATPTGRILNRASTDQSAVDESIPFQIGTFAFSTIELVGIIAVMSQVTWHIFITFVPVVATCIWYQQYYIATARELSRLVGVCNAPILQHFAETVSGSTTIRSFDQESRFMGKNLELISAYLRPKFYNAGAMEWLCFRLDMLSSLTFAFALVLLISLPKGVIDPSIAGLAVTYGLTLNTLQGWVIWNLCNLENKIISVERILQYTCIPSEPPLVIETNRPGHNWPSHGEVNICNLQVRYAPHFPHVLRGLTCTFRGGMKTGIVGRTGSGKSTLIQTLFRLVDPTWGQILIDGIDITTIGLHDLRSRLSVIPQDPTMFEGTVRSNLDPLEEYTDEQIWEALENCQLGEEVRKKEEKLNSEVTENGENWSLGQRQLFCLGRVLLKKSKILVLDEATASVDTATDSLIQRTLRQQFSDSTVITIAHRIDSILDSDMVLQLDHGLIVEYDSPTKLLENKSSAFAKLVAEYTLRSIS